jgi:hypothetical protein
MASATKMDDIGISMDPSGYKPSGFHEQSEVIAHNSIHAFTYVVTLLLICKLISSQGKER